MRSSCRAAGKVEKSGIPHWDHMKKRITFGLYMNIPTVLTRFLGHRHRRILLFLLVMGLAAYTAGLFVHVTRDASKYAAIAREIFDTGEYINLTIHGEAYVQKPPLLFWLSALSYRIFGVNDFAFKLPVLLFSLAGFFFTFKLGSALYDRKTGALAALLLASSQISFLYNMDIHTDSLMQSLVTLSLWQLFLFLKNGKNLPLIIGFGALGGAMLTKGPVGAVVPATAVAGYLLFTGRTRRIIDPRWITGLLIAGVTILPALAGLYHQSGWEGIRFYFWDNNMGRIQGTSVSKDTNYLFYLTNLLYLYAPWTILLFTALFLQFRALVHRRMEDSGWFLFWGIWVYFFIISVSHGKLPNYIYMLVPLFSVVTARMLVPLISGKKETMLRWLLPVQTIMAGLTGLLLSLLLFWMFPLRPAWTSLLLLPFLITALYPFFRGGSPGYRLLVPSLAMATALNLYINSYVAPQIFSDQASVKAASLFNTQATQEAQLGNYNYPSHELFFYARTPVRQLFNDLELFARMRTPGNWVLTTREVVDRMPQGEFPTPEITPLPHVWINNLTLRYLNPRTREAARDTLYLLRSTAVAPEESPH